MEIYSTSMDYGLKYTMPIGTSSVGVYLLRLIDAESNEVFHSRSLANVHTGPVLRIDDLMNRLKTLLRNKLLISITWRIVYAVYESFKRSFADSLRKP